MCSTIFQVGNLNLCYWNNDISSIANHFICLFFTNDFWKGLIDTVVRLDVVYN